MIRTLSLRGLRRLLLTAAWIGIASARAAAQVEPVFDTELANAPGQHLTAIVVRYAPGARSAPHHHDAAAFVYVLEGRIRSQVAGEAAARIYRAGDSWFEPAGAHHPVCGNASATQPARMLVVFVAGREAVLSAPD